MQYRETRFKMDKGTRHVDSCGAVEAKASIARVGVQKYYIDGKLIRELRLEDEVKKSASEFNNKALTLNHPIESVNTSNIHRYSKGFVNEVQYDSGWLTATIHITHQDAIDASENTHQQFSNGYLADIVDESGIWVDSYGVMGTIGKEYEYDAVQRNIVGNHVALVTKARAGDQATFLDSDDSENVIILDSQTIITHSRIQGEHMKHIIKYDSTELEVEGNDSKHVVDMFGNLKNKVSDLESQLNDMSSKYADMESKFNDMKTAADTFKGKVDGLNAELVESRNQPKLDTDAIAQEVKSRTAIWSLVSPHLDSDVDYSLDVVAVKKLHLKSELPNLADKMDKEDDSYVNGLWDIRQPSKVEPKVEPKVDATPSVEYDAGTKIAKTDDSGISDKEREVLANFYN